jgi:anti-sigma factor RsiW
MKGHEEIEQILASYRDATAEERARADAHVAGCAACAAKRVAFSELDAKLAGLPQPILPGRLARPLPAVLAPHAQQEAVRKATRFAVTRAVIPATAVLLLLVALAILMASRDSGRSAVTSTPTLTTTFTPTTVSARETEPPALIGYVPGSVGTFHGGLPNGMAESDPTPAPAPAPTPLAGNSQVLLAGFSPHATMIH